MHLTTRNPFECIANGLPVYILTSLIFSTDKWLSRLQSATYAGIHESQGATTRFPNWQSGKSLKNFLSRTRMWHEYFYDPPYINIRERLSVCGGYAWGFIIFLKIRQFTWEPKIQIYCRICFSIQSINHRNCHKMPARSNKESLQGLFCVKADVLHKHFRLYWLHLQMPHIRHYVLYTFRFIIIVVDLLMGGEVLLIFFLLLLNTESIIVNLSANFR